MEWPIICPHCGKVIDSYDSYADTAADMRDHIAVYHPGKDPNVFTAKPSS